MNRRDKIKTSLQRIREFFQLGAIVALKPYEKGLKELADSLGVGEGHLRKARQFYAAYGPDGLKAICRDVNLIQTKQPSGTPVFSPTHVVRLLAVPDGEERIRLQRAAIEEAWSVDRLQREIRRKYARRRGGGRPPRILDDDRGLLTQVESTCETWRRWRHALERQTRESPKAGERAEKARIAPLVARACEAVDRRSDEWAERLATSGPWPTDAVLVGLIGKASLGLARLQRALAVRLDRLRATKRGR